MGNEANGTTAERQFDSLLRLTNLVNRADAGVLSSFALTLDDADQRTQVVREDGKVYTYSYDADIRDPFGDPRHLLQPPIFSSDGASRSRRALCPLAAPARTCAERKRNACLDWNRGGRDARLRLVATTRSGLHGLYSERIQSDITNHHDITF